MTPNEIEVFPPHGFVKLTKWVGDELDIANAARVSFHKETKKIDKADEGLIRFLLRERHGTPFEHGFQSLWHIRLPIFVMREWVRHRIGHSINEESGRYTEMRPDFYIPDFVRSQVGKPGAYTFEPVDEQRKKKTQKIIVANNKTSWQAYQDMLDMGIAREVAREVLPLNLYTEMRWTANARSLMHFLSLRNAPEAMYEIRRYAEAMEAIFEKHMPITYEAFIQSGRRAP